MPHSERPTWRGWLHAGAFAAAIPAGLYLVFVAQHTSARVAAAIYGASVLLGFGTSAAYHRLARSERAQRIMQRMDHSMIYVLIAGSYTPVCLLAMPTAWGITMLCVVWTGALIGVFLKQFAFDRFRAVQYALYPILGWAAVISMPVLITGLSVTELLLLVAGGVIYTVGIPVLVRERPNPWPRTFGYHEVWHTCTVLAAMCHFALVGMLVA
jgi:hemolysin III